MAGQEASGPAGSPTNRPNDHRSGRVNMATVGPIGDRDRDRSLFESAIQALEAEIANVGAHIAIDAAARRAYAEQIQRMAGELRAQAVQGRTTWSQAASEAQQARNAIMDLIRARSTPVGRAMAAQLKSEGRTLNELVARKTRQLYGEAADFARLAQAERDAVYAEIVRSAGRSNPRITAVMRRLSRAGRGLIVLSLALSVYSIATADDKFDTAGRELAVTGAGIGGGIAGGALAGLACGPGAPVCVAIGAFAGGALAAFGVDLLW